jgi:hypothetical protein
VSEREEIPRWHRRQSDEEKIRRSEVLREGEKNERRIGRTVFGGKPSRSSELSWPELVYGLGSLSADREGKRLRGQATCRRDARTDRVALQDSE